MVTLSENFHQIFEINLAPSKVAILGCGSWASAISRIVGENVKKFPEKFEEIVSMWCFEEMVGDRKLSELINANHENVKYLPGKRLPANVIAIPDLLQSISGAKILIFVVPHQFVEKTCKTIAGHVRPDAICISLIKGLGSAPDGSGRLISSEIKQFLGDRIEMAVLMGANIAKEVAENQFSEATIGTENEKIGLLLKVLFDAPNFCISVVKDSETVEVCGALKNIVACAAGFCDGLGYPTTTKSAIIRLGLVEMICFIRRFFHNTKLPTFFQSCGVADLVATCYGGRNSRCSAVFVRTGQTIEEVEISLLNGQKLQGPTTAVQAFKMIEKAKLEQEFPLFVSVHKIFLQQMEASQLIDSIRDKQAQMK